MRSIETNELTVTETYTIRAPSTELFSDTMDCLNVPPPRKPRTVKKCTFCRDTKQSCSYSGGLLTARCKRCQEKGLSCSEPQLAPQLRRPKPMIRTENFDHMDQSSILTTQPLNLTDPPQTSTDTIVADTWDTSVILEQPPDKEALLLLSLYTIVRMAIEELDHLATAIIRPYRRDRILESTTDAIPELIKAVGEMEAIARAINDRMIEVGPNTTYTMFYAQNALGLQLSHCKHTWANDDMSTRSCKDSITYFQQLGFCSFAYVLQAGLMRQGLHMSDAELETLSSNRVSFVTEIDWYMCWVSVPMLSQFMSYQPFTPRELVHVPTIANAIRVDARPDYLGRSVTQIMYDAGVYTKWPTEDLNHSDSVGRTFLHQALQKDDITTIRSLTKLGINLWQCCFNGLTPLHIAACQGSVELTEILLAQRVGWLDHVQDKAHRTVFWYAARSSHFELMELLAARSDVDIDLKDAYGFSPLGVAARDGRSKLIKHLLKLRSTKWQLGVPGAVTDHIHDHHPLLLASQNGHMGCVDLILAYRTWNAGQAEYERTLDLATKHKDDILIGKLRDLWRFNAGVASLEQFYLPKAPQEISGNFFNSRFWDTMPCSRPSNATTHGGKDDPINGTPLGS